MNIVYYFAEQNTWMYKWQRAQIFPELNQAGHHIQVINPLYEESIDAANCALLSFVKANKVDVIMTPHNEELLYMETLKQLKSLGLPTILILFDSEMTPYRFNSTLPLFDLVMLSQKDRTGYYKKRGAKAIYSPYASTPAILRSIPSNSKMIRKMCFAGTPYGSRVKVINDMIKNRIPIDVYMNQSSGESSTFRENNSSLKVLSKLLLFPTGRKVLAGAAVKSLLYHSDCLISDSPIIEIKDPVGNDGMAKLYTSYSLSLSISEARNTGYLPKPVHILHLRNFEIPMCGGIQFCRYFDDLAECFEDGKEIIMYHSVEEMREKAKYWLAAKNESRLNAIRANARKRAMSEHRWIHRFNAAFREIGLR